jgi:hypothetical protein
MSRNTLRGLGKSGGHKGTREDASQSSDPSRSDPVVQTKAIQELTPEELKERIKEELRKIRELDAPEPNPARTASAASIDGRGGVPVSAPTKEPSLSSTIMGMPLPPSLSSKTILVTGVSEPRGGERSADLATGALASATSGGAPEELLEERTDREPIQTVSAEAARLRGTSFGRDLHLPGLVAGKASSRASEEVIIAEEVFPAPPPGRGPIVDGGHSGRELALRAEVAVPQRLDWEPTDVNPVGAPSAWAVPGEHDADHLPWYDQAPPHEEIYEEPRSRVPLRARKSIGVLLGVTLALGTFYLIRMNGGLRSRPAGVDINALVNRPAAVGPPPPSGPSSQGAPGAPGAVAPAPIIGTTADVTRLRGGPDEPGTMPAPNARASRQSRPEGPGRTGGGSLGEAPARVVGPAGLGAGTQRGTPRVPQRPPATAVVRPAGPANRAPGADVGPGPGRSDAKPRRVVSDGLLRLDTRGRPGASSSPSPASSPLVRGGSTGLGSPGPGTSPWGQGARGLPGQGPSAGNPGGGPVVGQPSPQEPTGTARPGTFPPRPKPSYDPDSTLPLNGD